MKLVVRNGRGDHMRHKHSLNRKEILFFFKSNPTATKMDCSKALGLSYPTVLKHIKEINGE